MPTPQPARVGMRHQTRNKPGAISLDNLFKGLDGREAKGIGYAVWAGIGSVGAAAFGSVLLDQALTLSPGILAGGHYLWCRLVETRRQSQASGTQGDTE